jgi:putative transposase
VRRDFFRARAVMRGMAAANAGCCRVGGDGARLEAPRGQTPVLHAPLTRDHLSVISGITPDGHLLMQVREHALRGPDAVCFLQHLLRHLPGKLLVIWNGAPIHRGEAVKDFVAQGGAGRLQLEQLPGYTPELNPGKGIWNYLKRVELRNVCCEGLPELRRALRLAKARLRHKRVVEGCFTQYGYAA